MTAAPPDLFLRSATADWSVERWEELPDDGNRYEVIAGVLYLSTSPSVYHQWLNQLLVELVDIPARREGWAYYFVAPVGVILPGARRRSPISAWCGARRPTSSATGASGVRRT